MTRDHIPSRRPAQPNSTADPALSPHPPSWGTIAISAAVPPLALLVASFPIAAAVALAALVGCVVGAATGVTLQRRYPGALDRALPIAARGSTAVRER
ncbi:MAG: hypothetical protein ACOCRD_04880 [Halorubrum sp.]